MTFLSLREGQYKELVVSLEHLKWTEEWMFEAYVFVSKHKGLSIFIYLFFFIFFFVVMG